MKKLIIIFAVIAMFSGCVVSTSPLVGSIYSDNVAGPVMATENGPGSKTGESQARMICGVSFGDASIQTAARNGNITKIHTVDQKVRHVLLVFAEVTTVVTGE